MVLYPHLYAKLLKFLTIKLSTIIRYDCPRDPKPTDNVFPNKVYNLSSMITSNGSASTHLVK